MLLIQSSFVISFAVTDVDPIKNNIPIEIHNFVKRILPPQRDFNARVKRASFCAMDSTRLLDVFFDNRFDKSAKD